MWGEAFVQNKPRMITFIAFSMAMLGVPGAASGNQDQTASSASEMSPASVTEANARIAAVQANVDAYRTGNIDRFVATFTKDAVVRADGFEAVGHDQIKALYALNFEPGAPKVRIHGSGIDGEAVVVSIGYVLEDGQEICCSNSYYEITNGKVSFLQSDMQANM